MGDYIVVFYDKRALYNRIEDKLCFLQQDATYPADIFTLLKDEKIELFYHPFQCSSIGAILCKDSISGILINQNKSSYDQHFDIAHELIHYWFHPNHTSFSFTNLETRDKEKEWQANEGAAELLLPYKNFIPVFLQSARFAEENYEPLETIYDGLSKHYQVNPIVIDYRIRNLESEILQVYGGVPLEEITITKSNVYLQKDKQPVLYRTLLNRLRKHAS